MQTITREKIKITIKQFHTGRERPAFKKMGLKPFNSLAFQFKMVPEGEYTIDPAYIFSNQYNTEETPEHKGYRIFEFCECLSHGNGEPWLMGRGYYIAEGIEKIRALQKQISVCGFCGHQYKNTKRQFCGACCGSEYLTPKEYKLLKLVNILKKDGFKYDDVVIPIELVEKIRKAQQKTRIRLLKRRNANKLASIKRDIKDSKKELTAFKWLIDHDINFENCIYYSHTDTFSFGWRQVLSESEQETLYKKMTGFPYSWEIKK